MGSKTKKGNDKSFRRVRRCQTQIVVANFVPKTRVYVNFIPALEMFFLFFLRETDHTSLRNIRTKGKRLKRLRSREISR